MKTILIGTTNPSKVQRFKELLKDYDLKFYTLQDLNIKDEPDESGHTPEENAIIKAKFYAKYYDIVLCNDSGLYFDCIPLNDQRQPGLNIRTPGGNRRLNDEEMITYYSKLVNSLGGCILAYYLDGIAVCNHQKIYSFMENSETTKLSAFYMVDKPSPKRHLGWPLDSISLNKNTLKYFVDDGNNQCDSIQEEIIIGKYRAMLVAFLVKALEL